MKSPRDQLRGEIGLVVESIETEWYNRGGYNARRQPKNKIDFWSGKKDFNLFIDKILAIFEQYSKRERIEELERLRKDYDDMEMEHGIDTMESPPREFVTWRGWKFIRNRIGDRIAELQDQTNQGEQS